MPPLIEPKTWGLLTLVAEAASEGSDGMTAVAEVIRNRMALRYASDGTVPGTILRPLAFSCWNTADPNRARRARLEDDAPIVLLASKAWDRAFDENTDLVHGATLYHADYMKTFPVWSKTTKRVRKIGRHIFYVDQRWLSGRPK